jgi:class 3 adenylate cyclase
MVSGNIGSISLKKLDFTVIGDTVNVASRLQSKANPGQILILDKFAHAAPEFKCNSIGKMELKNKALAVNVCEVE